jgi:hypothetical protein
MTPSRTLTGIAALTLTACGLGTTRSVEPAADAAIDRARQADLPLRHFRERDPVVRHPAAARGHPHRGRSDHRSVVGLKVDAEALPAAVVQGIKSGAISLKSPDTTVALLKLNAVVGVQGTVENVNARTPSRAWA